jgi:hypothetical protein
VLLARLMSGYGRDASLNAKERLAPGTMSINQLPGSPSKSRASGYGSECLDGEQQGETGRRNRARLQQWGCGQQDWVQAAVAAAAAAAGSSLTSSRSSSVPAIPCLRPQQLGLARLSACHQPPPTRQGQQQQQAPAASLLDQCRWHVSCLLGAALSGSAERCAPPPRNAIAAGSSLVIRVAC